MSMHFLLTSEDSPLNSASVVLILFNLYQQIMSYNRTKLKKVGNFYALTWLIFAGPVTFYELLISVKSSVHTGLPPVFT